MLGILILLIDTIAGKVTKFVVHGVLFRAEANKTVIKEIYFERVETGYESVDSDVILEAIEEVRIGNVFACNLGFWNNFALGNMCRIFEYLNSSATFCIVRSAHPETIISRSLRH